MTPFDGGVSYGSYRYHEGFHVEFPDDLNAKLNVMPMNAPVGPDLHYPPYGDKVTKRGHRSIGMVMASRVWNREIPLTARGVELFRGCRSEATTRCTRGTTTPTCCSPRCRSRT
ncbi:hypothetical protein Aple_012580 [Acrocarpospora pleiomorpha]|uniref:Uncharacterized protein n=1 Tax=Acrocarpospora pleiomorpha TaxID=90975 RepID=A0A5M3XH97_9ACTN|nr:hypothetical protein Aple_012580 [Acrocarpospora pleiomorpha]